jgi:hypothetical protein
MKIWLTILFSISISVSAFAQWSASVGTNQGYEWNIFKNPDLFVQSADTMFREDMWQNSVYSEGFINLDGRFPTRNGRLKLSADVSNNYYYQQQDAQKLFFKFKGSYRVKYARRKYFEVDPSFSRRLQDGVDQSDLVFSTRLSYQQFELPAHFDFYMGEKAWLRFDLRFRNRVYDAFQNQQTVFQSYFFQSEYKKRWEGLRGWEQELIFEAYVEYRDQELISTGQSSSIVSARQFLISNFNATPSVGRISDHIKVSAPFEFVVFKDQPTGSLDYIGWSSAVEIESEFDKSAFSIEAEYGNRLFRNFAVDSGDLLQYTNWNLSGTASFNITKNLEFQIKGRYLIRDSSRDRLSTTAYRGFQTSYIQTGFKVKL